MRNIGRTTKELNKWIREEENPILERRYYLMSLNLEVNEMLKAIKKIDEENVTREQIVPKRVEAVKKAYQEIQKLGGF